jgi:hypothetical protein
MIQSLLDFMRRAKMRYRKPMKKSTSKKLFRKTAKPHPKNAMGRPMRGGIRI